MKVKGSKNRPRGIAMTEYLVIMALVAIAAIVMTATFGTQIKMGLVNCVDLMCGRQGAATIVIAPNVGDVTLGDFNSGQSSEGGNPNGNGATESGGGATTGPSTTGVDPQSPEINYSVSGNVPVLKQPKSMDCWATAATMLVSWKESKNLSIADVVSRAGSKYLDAFKGNAGLSPDDKPTFLSNLGLSTEAPQNYTVIGWENLLKANGPLWVTTQEGGVHARIITGISGDGTPDRTHFTIIDPGTGKVSTESTADFVHKFEELVRNDTHGGADPRPQVVHF